MPWFALLLFGLAAPADRLDEVRQRGTLIWGSDAEGGGPFVFPDPDDADRKIGFEVEIAERLAKELGVKAVRLQSDWNKTLGLLDIGAIDVALNGFESGPELSRDYAPCRPYYAYGFQLMAPAAGPLKSWADVKALGERRKLRIGVLGASAAERYLQREFADSVEVASFDGNTDALGKAAEGALDGTLQDDTVAVFYAPRYPNLRFVERPVAGGHYVPVVKRGEERLRAALGEALEAMLADGSLEAIYDKWKLGGRQQALWLRGAEVPAAAPALGWVEAWSRYGGVLLQAAGVTVALALAAMPLAILLGMATAWGRVYGPGWLQPALTFYVEVFRGTPLLLQLYVLYFLLPAWLAPLGIVVPAFAAAVAGLALNYGACEAENYRAALGAVPPGQAEAALALGMTPAQAFRHVVLPQAARVALPPTANDFIALFKDTAVCSVVTVVELTKQYNMLAQSTGAVAPLAAATAALYLLMSYPLSLLARRIERRLGGK